MEEKIEEQLNINDDVNLDAVEQINKEMDKNSLESSSLLNKFKTVDALCKAYENLEKEFTKKCQKLKSMECENNAKDLNGDDVLPQEQKESWLNKMSSFLSENENAKKYVSEITDILLKDENLAKKDDALELAYSKILKQNFKTKEELASDDEFLNDYIYTNDNIKNKILQEYLLKLEDNKTIPLISSVRGSSSISSPKFLPKNLKDAGRYAENILKK